MWKSESLKEQKSGNAFGFKVWKKGKCEKVILKKWFLVKKVIFGLESDFYLFF